MILQALKEYYDRKAADPDSGIAPLGWDEEAIPFLVVIDDQGKFLRFEDTRGMVGKKIRARPFVVPSLGEAKGNGIKANILWENAEYMFGIPMRKESTPARVAEQHKAFIEKTHLLTEYSKSSGVLRAIMAFIEQLDTKQIQADPCWPEIKKKNPSLLLAINGQGAVTDIPEVRDAVNHVQAFQKKGDETLCSISGDLDVMALLESPIYGVDGTSRMGAHIVAVNNKVSKSGNGGNMPAFASFMKEQGANSPIGKTTSLAYTKALNTLLRNDSEQKIQVGDTTTVFWSARANAFEQAFGDLFWSDPAKDNPDRLTSAVAALVKSVETGAFVVDNNNTRFYVLGLAPANKARISVRFWYSGTVSELATNFHDYFMDLRIEHSQYPNEKDDLPLRWLLRSLVHKPQDIREWDKKIPPKIAGETTQSVLHGLPFPATLLQATLLRIKAERDVSYPRAKLIKGCLNRKLRKNNPTNERSLAVSLDKDNPNVGYRLGRLFAVMEQCQKRAQPGGRDMKTIRDRFYSSASSAPVTVFANLMRLNKHHLAKLPSGGNRFFANLIGEILYHGIDKPGIQTFPSHLSLEDQGCFAIGYYHQMQNLHTKKDKQEQPATGDAL